MWPSKGPLLFGSFYMISLEKLRTLSAVELQAIETFRKMGIHEVEILGRDKVTQLEVKEGAIGRCAEDRIEAANYGPDELIGSAIPGGIFGVAALIRTIDDVDLRFKEAIRRVEKTGQRPGMHGDSHKGDILGCGAIEAWILQIIEGLPSLSIEKAQELRHTHNVHHINVEGPHTAGGVLLNFEDDSTFLPEGKFLVKDAWYARKLGFQMDNILEFFAKAAVLILPPEKRKLYLVA